MLTLSGSSEDQIERFFFFSLEEIIGVKYQKWKIQISAIALHWDTLIASGTYRSFQLKKIFKLFIQIFARRKDLEETDDKKLHLRSQFEETLSAK